MIGGPPTASESTAGVAKLATNTDATTGTNNTKIMSPADVTAAIGAISGIGANETYGSGWNSDTGVPEKDDVYDYLHQFDVDDDGDIDTIDSTYWATKLNASEKAAASGVASLDGSSLVVQNPANATATPTASKIPIADGSGDLDAGWVPDTISHNLAIGSTTAGKNLTVNATLGAELITWTDAEWDEDGVTWTFAAGVLTHVTGNATTVTAAGITCVVGTTYKVTITGTGGGGTATYTLGGVTGTTIAASGAIAITDYITASTTASLIITPATACTVAITNISVKALTDATGDLTVDRNTTFNSPIKVANGGSATFPTIDFGGLAGLRYANGTFCFSIAGGDKFTFGNGVLNLLWDISYIRLGTSADVILVRDAANTLALRNSTSQNKFRVANTWTNASNYEYGAITGVQGTSINLTAETAGTGGDNLDIVLTPAGTGKVTSPAEIVGANYKTIFIPASACTSTATNGATLATTEYATNDINMDYYAFDGATEQYVEFQIPMPEDWNRGTIKAKCYWTSATGSTANDTVEWEILGGALSNDDAIDAALGTAQVISDTLLADNGTDLQVSGATPALTVGGTPALGDMIHFKVSRNVGGTDDMTENAWLLGVWIQYLANTSVAAW
jgi:hypothetical protein